MSASRPPSAATQAFESSSDTPSSLAPLPDEILQLSDSETACQYCGISYLLLNKYEKMSQHVQELRTQLSTLQDYESERPSLLSRISILTKQHQESTDSMSALTKSLDTSERRNTDLQARLDHRNTQAASDQATAKARLAAAVKRGDALFKRTTSLRQTARTLAQDLAILKTEQTNQAEALQTGFRYSVKDIQAALLDSIPRQVQHAKNISAREAAVRLDAVERDYTSRIAGLEADAAKGAEVARNLENALSAATAKIRGNARDTAASDAYNSLQLQLEELKTSTKAQVDKLSSQKASIDSRNSQLQKQLTAVTRALDESRRCTSDVKEKLEERIREQAVGGDERVKALNAAMALKDKTIFEQGKSLKEVEERLQSLNIDRDKTVEAHQSRIKQLQEKFLQDLEKAKSDRDIEHDQEHREQFAKKLELAEVEANRRQLELVKQHREAMDRLESKISRLEREIKDKHGENEKLTRDVRVLDQTSKKAIDSLSARVKILTEENRKLLVLEKTGNNDKEKTAGDLGSKEAEIAFLKNTVRIECEERMHLLATVERLKRGASRSSSPSLPPIAKAASPAPSTKRSPKAASPAPSSKRSSKTASPAPHFPRT